MTTALIMADSAEAGWNSTRTSEGTKSEVLLSELAAVASEASRGSLLPTMKSEPSRMSPQMVEQSANGDRGTHHSSDAAGAVLEIRRSSSSLSRESSRHDSQSGPDSAGKKTIPSEGGAPTSPTAKSHVVSMPTAQSEASQSKLREVENVSSLAGEQQQNSLYRRASHPTTLQSQDGPAKNGNESLLDSYHDTPAQAPRTETTAELSHRGNQSITSEIDTTSRSGARSSRSEMAADQPGQGNTSLPSPYVEGSAPPGASLATGVSGTPHITIPSQRQGQTWSSGAGGGVPWGQPPPQGGHPLTPGQAPAGNGMQIPIRAPSQGNVMYVGPRPYYYEQASPYGNSPPFYPMRVSGAPHLVGNSVPPPHLAAQHGLAYAPHYGDPPPEAHTLPAVPIPGGPNQSMSAGSYVAPQPQLASYVPHSSPVYHASALAGSQVVYQQPQMLHAAMSQNEAGRARHDMHGHPIQTQPYSGPQLVSTAPGVVRGMVLGDAKPVNHLMPITTTHMTMGPTMNAPRWDPGTFSLHPSAWSNTLNQDIKRRTKTGCLTCRRRRVKCDEQHPQCRNCLKSERVCLGYDTIFSFDRSKRVEELGQRRRMNRTAMRAKAMTAGSTAPRPAVAESASRKEDSSLGTTGKGAPQGALPEIKTWADVAQVFNDRLAGALDGLLGTAHIRKIAGRCLDYLSHGDGRFVNVAGEVEVMRQLLAIVYPEISFSGLSIFDMAIPLEKLRTTEDYCTLRAIAECLSPEAPSSLPDSLADSSQVRRADQYQLVQRMYARLNLLSQLLHGHKNSKPPTGAVVATINQLPSLSDGRFTDSLWSLLSSMLGTERESDDGQVGDVDAVSTDIIDRLATAAKSDSRGIVALVALSGTGVTSARSVLQTLDTHGLGEALLEIWLLSTV